MRPLKLKFAGLRSYLAPQEIDFSGVNLMAIVGVTGAGKSSILEALYFALYGMSTWDARSGKGLIADGGDGTVRAELTFRAKGKTWQVTRTTSAGGYPPSTHLLTCLDDDRIRVETARGVDAEIRRLIGLDHTTFLKAVVLPQGRFQELLQTPESNRTTILKSVLGLDHITEIRNHAKTLHDDLLPHLSALRERRASLLENPEHALREALRLLFEAQEEIGKLQEIKTTVTEAQKTYTESTRRAHEYQATAHQLETRIPAGAGERYQELIDLDVELQRELTTLEDQLHDAEVREEELTAVFVRAEIDGTGTTDVASALATLRSLLDQLPGIEEEHRQHDAEDRAIEGDRTELRKRNEAHTEIGRTAEAARVHAVDLYAAHRAAMDMLDQHRRLLADARQDGKAVETATAKLETARTKAEDAENAVAEAEALSSQADKQADDADERVEAALRMNSAAHAAAHSKPGDPCPVCTRTLPKSFTAPDTTDVAQVKAARTRTRNQARARGEELAAARESRDIANDAVGDALGQVREAISQHEMAVNLVTSGLGDVNFNLDDDTLLTDDHAKIVEAAEALEEAEEAAGSANDTKVRDITEIRGAEQALAKRETELSQTRARLKRRQAKLIKSYNELPATYRLSVEPSVSALEQAVDLAKRREGELEEAKTRLTAAQAAAKRLRDTKNGMTGDIQDRVVKPAEQLSRTVQAVADNATAGTGLTALPVIPERPESRSVAADAQWAIATLDQVRKTIRRYHDEASAQEILALQAKAASEEALAGLGVASSDVLDERLVAAKANLQVAERDRDLAQSQRPVCVELDRRIAAATPLIESLGELNSLLADGKFMAAVVKRRQRALLGIASDLLRSMTGERFGFSGDFRIIDAHTGQPRDVKTLSGGETFLASLALALALVQLTSRGGGHVQALFLDEGFGSLDANVLAEALEALTGQATGGRLVAVISHMRAVAENFDDVLMVTRALSGGSKAKWASQAERDRLVADDLATGLLA